MRVDGDAMRRVELPWLIAGFAPGLQPVPFFVDFGDARIDVAIADIRVAGGVPGHVGDLGGTFRQSEAAAA